MSDEAFFLTRSYLTEREVDRLAAAAASTRHGLRDAALIRIAFLHALRVSEAIDLRLGQIDFAGSTIFCRRLKGSDSNLHPLNEHEVQMLKALIQGRSLQDTSVIFAKSTGGPLTRQAVWKIIRAAGVRAGLGGRIHPHMLKHAAGYSLINRGQDLRLVQAYMGHRQVMNTVRYTAVDAERFRRIWDRG